jgi:hypothetical protein
MIGKPQFSKGTKVYEESKGQWFTSGLVENWGRLFHADDESKGGGAMESRIVFWGREH